MNIVEGMELLNFQIISNVGDGKSYLFQALKAAREEKFEDAEKYIELAEESLVKAHEIHMEILQKETQGKSIDISLLLMHAEDQMMTTELLRDMTNEMLFVHRKYSGAHNK
ncbi:PTS lactose/cellobiose transporter subunit IIA [Schnuerera sp. xch1]|uniref:PTS lactose/cellobiose transporter subunit IIA n=1 Tax=Schnuerera sp. xch1 TaxID=2874283 RepID=UPI001CBDA81F|nr:PTS lactose/cellobiose transporter subunit IIA [Schnuerera sp. xch1]MBZ2175382.1 PTS lactose/cellobiose transporter subunit IIA [Schnuerera sp. xch1]